MVQKSIFQSIFDSDSERTKNIFYGSTLRAGLRKGTGSFGQVERGFRIESATRVVPCHASSPLLDERLEGVGDLLHVHDVGLADLAGDQVPRPLLGRDDARLGEERAQAHVTDAVAGPNPTNEREKRNKDWQEEGEGEQEDVAVSAQILIDQIQ